MKKFEDVKPGEDSVEPAAAADIAAINAANDDGYGAEEEAEASMEWDESIDGLQIGSPAIKIYYKGYVFFINDKA